MQNKTETLQPDSFYHIYSRANGNEKIFISDDNFNFFLEKYKAYIHPIANTYCYCLMPNHFHFLVQIKDENEIVEFFKKEKLNLNLQGFENLEGLISKQFSNFLNSYAKAFNKQQNRKGSLFMHTFKRKKIITKEYLYKIIHYIHFNPVEAGLCKKPENWPYSSYNGLISQSSTLMQCEKVIDLFDDVGNFVFVHQHPLKETGIEI
ncbi:MAG: transposase [Bacteroidota bacterium]